MPKNKGKTDDGPAQERNSPVLKKVADEHVMTGREYMETPEYKQKTEEETKEMLRKLGESMEPGMRVIREAQESIERSGIFEIAERIGEQQKIFEELNKSMSMPAIDAEVLFAPKEAWLSPRTIDEIALRAAEKFEKKIVTPSDASEIFIFEESGDLYRKNDSVKRYRLRGKGMRHKTVRILFEHSRLEQAPFKNSAELAEEAGYKNREALAKAIAEINSRAKVIFELLDEPEKRLITSKDFDGYRINPIYKFLKG